MDGALGGEEVGWIAGLGVCVIRNLNPLFGTFYCCFMMCLFCVILSELYIWLFLQGARTRHRTIILDKSFFYCDFTYTTDLVWYI